MPGVPLLALTATATKAVEVDVRRLLAMEKAVVFRLPSVRTNLRYSVEGKADNAVEQVAHWIQVCVSGCQLLSVPENDGYGCHRLSRKAHVAQTHSRSVPPDTSCPSHWHCLLFKPERRRKGRIPADAAPPTRPNKCKDRFLDFADYPAVSSYCLGPDGSWAEVTRLVSGSLPCQLRVRSQAEGSSMHALRAIKPAC